MTIYLIAGPPGIGKSTHSKSMVPTGVPIVDQDLTLVGVAYDAVTEITADQNPLPRWVVANNLDTYL